MKEQTISNLKKMKSFHNGSYGADIDMAIKALKQQPCEDCISREQAVYVASGYCAPQNIADELRKLPSVTPQPSIEEWLSSFNTNSAPQCFNAVQELKKKIEEEEPCKK